MHTQYSEAQNYRTYSAVFGLLYLLGSDFAHFAHIFLILQNWMENTRKSAVTDNWEI